MGANLKALVVEVGAGQVASYPAPPGETYYFLQAVDAPGRPLYKWSGVAWAVASIWGFVAPLLTTVVPTRSGGSPTATFTRATTATVTDWENIVRPVLSGEVRFQGARRVRNLVTASEDASGWSGNFGGVGSLGVRTANFGVAPDGTTTATRIQCALNGGVAAGDQSYITVPSTATVVNDLRSCWMKSNGGTVIVGLTVASISAGDLMVVTSTWQRCANIPKTNINNFQIGLRGGNGTSDSCDILVWRPQREDVTGQSNTNPGEYVSVGVLASPFQGAMVDGVQYFATQNGNTVNANVVTEGKGAWLNPMPLGYLAEGARTNLCLQSEDASDASWTKTDTVITVNNTTAPDGNLTADLLTEGVAGTANLNQLYTGTANVAQTFSRWVKRGNHDWIRFFILETGVVGRCDGWFNVNTGVVGSVTNGGPGTGAAISVKAYPNGWYRVTFSGSPNNANTGYRTGTLSALADLSLTTVNNSTRFEWGGQIENNASFASSYIPTTTVAVTRNADVLTYPSAGNVGSGGAIYAEAMQTVLATGGNFRIVSINDGTNNNVIDLITTPSNFNLVVSDTGVGQANLADGAVLATMNKIAGRFGLNNFGICVNGGSVALDVAGTVPAVTTINIGLSTAINQNWFGTIRNVQIATTQIPDTALQAATT